jgi:tetratricopeptide (TPR) repeat protein
MSRAWLPRRLAAGIAVLTMLCCASAAAAQTDTGPNTVVRLGADSHARACSDFAAVLDRTDAAIARCDRALRDEAGNRINLIITYINRGNLRLARAEYAMAIADFDAAIRLEPENAEAQLNKGVALIAMEQFGPAIVVLTEAVSLGVQEPHKAYYNRAVAREALGDFRGALEDYSTALAIRPDWGMADAEQQRLARRRQELLAQHLED